MFEKVSPSHPDKIADRIAGAITDLAYSKNDNPKIATEVLIGHGLCTVICETSEEFTEQEICDIVHRIAGAQDVKFICVRQDIHLAKNQHKGIRCGDNGIFKGVPASQEQVALSKLARELYEEFPTDGKFIAHHGKLVICQSNAKKRDIQKFLKDKGHNQQAVINPLGDWTGGCNVDTGATNRKLGSDMADGVTGGGLHGKDLSKADVSVNIFCHLMAQETNREYKAVCAIGDESVNGYPYKQIVEIAREYIKSLGGFEKFAEWGLY